MDPFVHLHVASGYSMRYGANHPADLVARAAEHGMDALALTDRDGLYGAVKFALACRSAGIRPVFWVDLAVAPAVDAALPRPLGRALGETMAVTMLIGNKTTISLSPFAMGNSIASVIANEFTEATTDIYLEALFEIGLVLFGVTILVNLIAQLLLKTMTTTTSATRAVQ